MISSKLPQSLKAFSGKHSIHSYSNEYPPPLGPAVFINGHWEKTEEPIFMTLLGRTTDFSFVQFRKQPLPMAITLSGIIMFSIPVPSKTNWSKYLNVEGSVIVVSLEQPLKQLLPNSVMPSGKLIDVNPEQPRKHSPIKQRIPSGRLTDVIFVQFKKANCPIARTGYIFSSYSTY